MALTQHTGVMWSTVLTTEAGSVDLTLIYLNYSSETNVLLNVVLLCATQPVGAAVTNAEYRYLES